MERLIVNADIENNKEIHKIRLSLVEFKEDNNIIIYSPALDLNGYGKTEEEAIKSFTVTLSEFVKYTSNKKTIDQVLISLGWKKRKAKDTFFIPPKNTDLISTNKEYSDIINNKEYRVLNREVQLC